MSILDELGLGRRVLPVITAAEAAECGLACMAMVSRYHGHDVDLNGLRQRYAFSLAGASLKSLMTIADQLGFSTRALKVELSALPKIHLPAILHWDLNHFVVLKSVGRGGRLVVHDPAVGARTLALEEVSKHFTGVVLELARAESFAHVKARTPMKLSLLWSHVSGWSSALAQVLMLSAALQIAAFVAPCRCNSWSMRPSLRPIETCSP
jgi:ATP-binding cassette subfamily B protein RaxB